MMQIRKLVLLYAALKINLFADELELDILD